MPETMSFPLTHQGVRDLDNAGGDVIPVSGGPAKGPDASLNVGETERWLSSAGGAALALAGLARGDLMGLGLAAVGGALVYRGMTGHCHLFEALGMNTARAADPTAEVVYRPR